MFDGFDEAQTGPCVGGGPSDAVPGGGRGAGPWVGVTVPMVVPVGWSHGHIRQGLAELERIHREYEAANAVLIAALPATRDLTADLTRNNGISAREAKRQREMADVTKKLPGALVKLRNGEISADHVTALSSVKGLEGAEKLLEGAGQKSPEALAKEAEQFKLASENAADTAKRQWAARSFRFFNGRDGMLGLTGFLPPVVGAEFRARVEAVRDAKWRLEHPERASTLGGHGGDTPEQRLADALLHLTGCTDENLSWPTQPKSKTPPPKSPKAGTPVDEESSRADPRGEANPAGAVTGPAHHGPIVGDGPVVGHLPIDDDESAEDDRPASDSGPSRSGPTESSGGVSAPISLRTEKRAVVITFNVDAWQAQIIGGGPIPVTESLFDQARNSLYYAFTNMAGEVLKIGRARRDPTPLQRLVVMVRDQTCVYPGCNVPATRTEVHHFNEYGKDCGTTDTDCLGSMCSPHHHHVHLNDLIVRKCPDGTIEILQRDTKAIVATSQRPG
jgi:hypothetical protein